MTDEELDEVARTEAAKELVIRPVKGKKEETLSLDAHVGKLAEYDECRKSIAFWEKRRERIKAELAAIMGDSEVGTVNGEAVLFYRPEERFKTREFAKQYPDFYRLYSRDITKQQFDAEWLKDERPDLYAEFQVRAMRNTFEA